MPDFMVMSDSNRHTILRVEVGEKSTSFISRDKKGVDLRTLPNRQFDELYPWQYPDHPLQGYAKSVWNLLEYGVLVAPRARRILALFEKEPPMATPTPTPAKAAADAAKPVKTPKAPAAEGEKKAVGKRIPNQKIRVLVKDNPKRPSSNAFQIFNLYATYKTTDEFLANGGTSAALRYDVEHKFIELY